MKASFNAAGTITIETETDLEAYALRHWMRDNEMFTATTPDGRNVVVIPTSQLLFVASASDTA